jgi:branched-chain amino acid aminotransferase
MSDLQFYAVTAAGPLPLPTPAGATDFLDLYQGLTLGVYSVLRTFAHNKFLHLADHLARTAQSMRLLGWQEPLAEAALRRALHTVCTAAPYPETRVRIDVLAQPAHALGVETRLLIALMPFTPPPATLYSQGVAVGFAQGLARANSLVKLADFATARQRTVTGVPAYEALLLDPAGRILEGVSSNFYSFRRGALYTAGAEVLEGVTRRIILQLAATAGIPVHFEPVSADQVGLLDEAAISSSSRGLVPVVAIEGQPISDGRPGPLTRRLMGEYEAYVRRTVKTAVED